jgi:hypothetical protein
VPFASAKTGGFAPKKHEKISRFTPENQALSLPHRDYLSAMILIRRMDDGKRSYTAIFLPGEPARVFPTSDQEHARVLAIFKQDRPHADVCNDFTDYLIGQDAGR